MRTNASTRVAAAVTAAYVLDVAGQPAGRRRPQDVSRGARGARRPRPVAPRFRDHARRSPVRVR